MIANQLLPLSAMLFSVFSALVAPAAAQSDEQSLTLIREEMKKLGFAPVRPAGQPKTYDDFLANYRKWLQRNFAAPMKSNTAAKPWGAEANAFVQRMIEVRFSRNFTAEPVAQQAPAARKLVAAGADDAVVLWLAAEALGYEWKDATEVRNVAAKAREAFRKSGYSKTLGTLLYLQKAARNRAAWEKEDEEAYQKSAEYLTESLTEAAAWTDEDAPIYINIVYEWFAGETCRTKKEVFDPVYHPQRFPEWARETLAGFWEIELGWEGRGSDWAFNVTEEGWLKFGEHLTKANAHLTKAWKLEPKQPFAATRMIAVAMADHALESPRTWFDRAVTAQIDYLPAWRALSWSMRPRWGGNISTMKGLALATVECGNFDTHLPFHLINELDHVVDELRGQDKSRDLYSEPAVGAALKLMTKNYGLRAKTPAEKDHWKWWYAACTWEGRDLAATGAALTSLGATATPMPVFVRNRLARIQADAITLRGEAALHQAGKLDAWTAADQAYFKYDLETAGKLLDTMTSIPAAEPLLIRRRNTLTQETKLAAGEWVKLSAEPTLADWMLVLGDCTGDASGRVSLTGDGNRSLLVHRTKIGKGFEARGTVTAAKKDKPFMAGFVIGHVGVSGGPGSWVTAEFNSLNGNSSARINQNWYKTGIPQRKFTADFSKPVAWTMKLENDRLTWTMNGTVLYDGELLARDKDLDGHYNAVPNARFGFCSRVTPEENELKFSPVEIRRLK